MSSQNTRYAFKRLVEINSGVRSPNSQSNALLTAHCGWKGQALDPNTVVKQFFRDFSENRLVVNSNGNNRGLGQPCILKPKVQQSFAEVLSAPLQLLNAILPFAHHAQGLGSSRHAARRDPDREYEAA